MTAKTKRSSIVSLLFLVLVASISLTIVLLRMHDDKVNHEDLPPTTMAMIQQYTTYSYDMSQESYSSLLNRVSVAESALQQSGSSVVNGNVSKNSLSSYIEESKKIAEQVKDLPKPVSQYPSERLNDSDSVSLRGLKSTMVGKSPNEKLLLQAQWFFEQHKDFRSKIDRVSRELESRTNALLEENKRWAEEQKKIDEETTLSESSVRSKDDDRQNIENSIRESMRSQKEKDALRESLQKSSESTEAETTPETTVTQAPSEAPTASPSPTGRTTSRQ